MVQTSHFTSRKPETQEKEGHTVTQLVRTQPRLKPWTGERLRGRAPALGKTELEGGNGGKMGHNC